MSTVIKGLPGIAMENLLSGSASPVLDLQKLEGRNQLVGACAAKHIFVSWEICMHLSVLGILQAKTAHRAKGTDC